MKTPQFLKCLIILWMINVSGVLGEPISIGLAVIAFGLYLYNPNIVKDTINHIDEPCSIKSIHKDLHSVQYDLKDKVHGQDLAISYIHAALKNHLSNPHNTKALALSLHGLPGTGKNFVSEIIVQNIFPKYKEFGKSRFVHKFNSRIHFPNDKDLHLYKRLLKDWIISNVTACQQSFFIFDEVDKFPKDLLNVLNPFLDHHSYFNGVSFRNAVFIFLSNAGGKEIMDRFMELRNSDQMSGKSRRDLNLNHFEHEIKFMAYNDPGGFRTSDVIGHNLIDHYLPFLPLEREHVIKCIQSEYNHASQEIMHLDNHVDYNKLEEYVMSGMTFDHDNLLSTTGCKRVKSKVQTYIARHNLYY